MSRFAWIFDLDGTLFESHFQIVSALNKARAERKYPEIETRVAMKLIGRPAKELFDDLSASDEDKGELLINFRNYLLDEVKSGTPLYKGTVELLREIHQFRQPIGVATMKPDNLAVEMIKLSECGKFVQHVQGSTGLKPKPDPEVLMKTLHALSASTGVLIGDRPEDIQCAKNAGIYSIGVAQTSFSKADLAASGADLAYGNIEELRSDLTKIKIILGF
jgi:phosphoglycolate phosphatase